MKVFCKILITSQYVTFSVLNGFLLFFIFRNFDQPLLTTNQKIHNMIFLHTELMEHINEHLMMSLLNK